MFHHSRSKSAPCYNFSNEKANQILFSNTLPVPHTPESLLNWQFGDAPAHSPRRDISYGPAISTSTNSIKQQQQTFALDNQFFNGGVLDWDVSIDTISTAIEETKKAKETTPTFQVPQFPSNRMIKSVRDGDDVDYLKPMSYPTRLMGSINNTGSHEEHRRHASFTCFPNIQDMNLTEEQIEEIYHPLKKKKFSANSSNSDTNQADDSSVAPSASSPLSPTSPSSCGADNVAPSSMKKKKARSLVRSSGFRGVSKCSKDGRWQARIRVGESVRYLGRFLTQEEAALCYDNAARMYHGSKAILNFKGPGDEHLTQSKKLASMVARMERKIEFEVV